MTDAVVINENVMEALLLILLRNRTERGPRWHNIHFLGVKRGSNLARTMEADGLIEIEESRSGSYLLGIYAWLTEQGLELAEQIAREFTPAWIEVRVNYWDHLYKEPKIGEAVRFVDRGFVIAEGTGLTDFNGGGGLAPDGKHRTLHLLRPLKPNFRGKIREIPVFVDGWQASCPAVPYGDGSPAVDSGTRLRRA